MPLGGPPQVPWLVGLGGLAIAFALFGLMWSLASARHRAMTLAAAMTADLRAADRAKDEWLSVISHELRTPLNFITGFASLLEDDVGGKLAPEQQGYVTKILAGADRMLALVNDLLDVAKIRAGKFDLALQPTPLAPLVEEVVESMRPLAVAKGQVFTATIATEVRDLTFNLDGPRVVQVLTNLLSNAVKFTPPGGTIDVTLTLTGDTVHVAVADTGVGIVAEDIPKLFEPFRQLDMSSTRAVGGTGLGLSICKALVLAHGGEIGLTSTPLTGTTFYFTLPVR